MGEVNKEASFAYNGYGRGVCSSVAEVFAIQAQACKVVTCRDCIITPQLRLRLEMPVDIFGSRSALSPLFNWWRARDLHNPGAQ
jgi:hypothetical protein